ncbi:MAG: IS110 family transposase [Verrucomicrobia bacterium]|nr:IS110 family transposase [Verrucomicrobiota bacterium]
MPRYVGLDVHKQFIEACFIDEQGKQLHRCRVAVTRESIQSFITKGLQSSDHVVMEATTNTWEIAELIRPRVAKVAIANPLKVKAIAEAKTKTDKVDAEVLAQLLRCDFLPEVWIPDQTTRLLREMCAHRAALVADQTRIKNRIQSLLAQRLIPVPVILFNGRGRNWLSHLELSIEDRALIDGYLRVLDQIESEEVSLQKASAQLSYGNEQIRLLMTLPGVGPAGAQALYAALGDWNRFRDGAHAASYLGLTPSTRQSANHCYHGSITKAGNSLARWLITQAAQQVCPHPGPLGVFFRRIRARKNHNIAVVATARKLVTIAFLMLKNNEPYRYSSPGPTQRKLSAFRCAATGSRRPKSKLRLPMQRREPGIRVQSIPSLDEVYWSENLPSITHADALPSGERRALQQMGIADLPERLQVVQTRSYRSKKFCSDPAKKTGESNL